MLAECRGRVGYTGEEEFCFLSCKFEMLIRHPSGMSSWELGIKIWDLEESLVWRQKLVTVSQVSI